jgi:hypothetical protein
VRVGWSEAWCCIHKGTEASLSTAIGCLSTTSAWTVSATRIWNKTKSRRKTEIQRTKSLTTWHSLHRLYVERLGHRIFPQQKYTTESVCGTYLQHRNKTYIILLMLATTVRLNPSSPSVHCLPVTQAAWLGTIFPRTIKTPDNPQKRKKNMQSEFFSFRTLSTAKYLLGHKRHERSGKQTCSRPEAWGRGTYSVQVSMTEL